MSATLYISIVLFCPEPENFGQTLTSLAAALSHAQKIGSLAQCRILLTDHSPRPALQGELQKWRGLLLPHAEMDYHHAGTNPGFGAGHNAAFVRAGKDSDYFLVANPDLVFEQESLATGIAFLQAHQEIGLLAPALIEPEGGIRPACFRYPGIATLMLRVLGKGPAHPRIASYECRDWQTHSPTFNPPLISGCCMLFRSPCYAEFGGFDPGYFLYFEDFDLSWRIGREGRSAFSPAIRIRHEGGGASRKGWRHRQYFIRSAWRFFNAHGWRW